jgi:hypothetical protein
MANTTVSSDLQVTKYLSDFFQEYIRNSRFSRYTGTGSNNVITIKEGRKKIEVPLVLKAMVSQALLLYGVTVRLLATMA